MFQEINIRANKSYLSGARWKFKYKYEHFVFPETTIILKPNDYFS